MTKEKDGKLLYHLTALENLESIFQNGLKSRATLAAGGFEDVADGEIMKIGLVKWLVWRNACLRIVCLPIKYLAFM